MNTDQGAVTDPVHIVLDERADDKKCDLRV